MPYCVPADVVEVLDPAGLNIPGSAAGLPSPALLDLIDEASARVNGRLAERYTVPFVDGSVPDLVKQITRDIAAYYAVLAANQGDPLPAGHPAVLRYQAAMSDLVALSNGSMTLTDADPTSPPDAVPGDAAVANLNDGCMFTPGMFGLAPCYPVPDSFITG